MEERYVGPWHEADFQHPRSVGRFAAASPTLGAECPFCGAFKTRPEAALRVGK